jgi:hypothetical protein
MSLDTVKNILSNYISKIEIIGHKKSLVVEIRLYAKDQEAYNFLYNNASLLGSVENIAQLSQIAFDYFKAMNGEEIAKKAEKVVKEQQKQKPEEQKK